MRNMKMKETLKGLVLFAVLAFSLFLTIPTVFGGASGSGWKPDVSVVQDTTSPDEDDVNPSLATDSQGRLYNAKQIYDASAGRWKIKIHGSTDQGASWVWVATLSWSGYDLVNPSLAIDPATDIKYVAFTRAAWTITEHSVWLYSFGDYSFHQIADMAAYQPSLTCEYQYGVNYLYVSYHRWGGDLNNQDLLVARSTDGGVTWEEKVARGLDDTDVYDQAKITNAQGYIYVVYRHSEYWGGLGHIDVTRFHWSEFLDPTTWKHSEDVSMVKNDVSHPSIAATHGGDTVLVAYEYESDDGDLDVLYAYSQDQATKWVGGTYWAIANSPVNEKMPAVTVDGMGSTSTSVYGNFHLIYTKEETIGTRHNGIYYTQIPYWGFPPYHEPNWPIGCFKMPWSSPQGQIIDDDGWASTVYYSSITTYQRTVDGEDLWMPGVAWTDYRGYYYDVYYSTIDTEFRISFWPSHQTVVAGGSMSYYVTVTLLGGTTAEASLAWRSTLGCICGVSAEYNPSTVTPTDTSILTIFTSNLLGHGDYAVYSTATIGGYRRIVEIPFTVTAAPSLTLQLSPTTVAPGDTLTISGQLTPSQVATIRLYRRVHGTTAWTFTKTIDTDITGTYSLIVTVPMWVAPGDYDLVTVWFDEATAEYAASPIVVLTIT